MNTTPSSPASGKRKRWYFLPIPAVLIAAGLSLHFYRLHQADASPPAEGAPWALRTAAVERGSVAGSIESVAVVEAAQDIVLSPQIQGSVLAIGPRAGVAVKRGELLLRIDGRVLSSSLSALEQQRIAALADADYSAKQQARIDALLAEGGVSQAQADQARSAAQGARAKARSLADQIDALRVTLGYAEIRAPQDAVVAERMVELGDTVAPGKPVYRLTAGKGAVVRVSLPAAELAHVHAGDTLQLQQGAATVTLPIKRVAPAVNASGLGTAEADAPSAPFGLPSGSTIAATLRTTASGDALTVPVSALVGSGTGAHVLAFVPGKLAHEPGRLRLVPVSVLELGGSRAAVRGALTPGEQLAVGQTAVLAQLRDGDAAIAAASAGAAQ